MFERFTGRVHRVVVLAQNKARDLRHNYLSTKHFLLGLIREGEGVAAKALEALDIILGEVRVQVINVTSGGQKPPSGHIPFTPRAKKVIEYTMREGLQLGYFYINTEHLLLGLMREPDGVAAQVLTKLGTSMTRVRSQVNQLISGFQGKEPVDVGGGAREGTKASSAVLDQYGRNPTQSAHDHKLGPVIGCHMRTERVMQVFSRRTENNPVLVGEPGVGKTTVVGGFAQAITSGSMPKTLKDKQLYSLDMGSLVTDSRYRGDFEDRMKKVLKEVSTRGDIMFFIDKIHSLVDTDAAEGTLNAASLLKPMMTRGELQAVNATMLDEYRKHIEKDAALEGRFQPIQVEQPTAAQTVEILRGLRDRYESFHHVTITDGAIDTAASLANRYVNNRFLPDKAIDLIDETGARLAIHKVTAPPELHEIDERIVSVRHEKEAVIDGQGFEKAVSLRDEEQHLGEKRAEREQAWKDGDMGAVSVASEDLVTEVLSMATGIPVFKLSRAESTKLLRMEEELHKRVIGRNEAVIALSQAIRHTHAGLKDPNRPGGSFIFTDPAGVGETELAKALAEFLLSDEPALIALSMSGYSEKHAVSRLFGTPPGCTGYDEGGRLAEKARREPFPVVLLDEVKKAHPDLFNSLLQVLEEGRLTDSQGRMADFKSMIIIMTTNLGTKDITKGVTTGFQLDGDMTTSYERTRSHVGETLKERFRPEFLNRVDDMIVFPQLQREEILRIVDLMTGKLDQRLARQEMHLVPMKRAKELLVDRGYDPVLGVRPPRRATQRGIEDVLSEKLLFDDFARGQAIVADVDEENIPVTFTSTPYDADTELPQDVVTVTESKSMNGLTAGVDSRHRGADITQPSGLSAAN